MMPTPEDPKWNQSAEEAEHERTRQRFEDIKWRLDELIDIYTADQRMADLAAGRSQRHTVSDDVIEATTGDHRSNALKYMPRIGTMVLGFGAILLAIFMRFGLRSSRL